jgi:secondary thiamine-phosphate synthase enzyme
MSKSQVGMSKTSTATVRQRPVRDIARSAKGMRVHGETLAVQSDDRIDLHDVTDRVMALVHGSGVVEGFVNVWSMHTTCAVFINEHQRALLSDMKRFLEEMVAKDAAWLHNDPQHSDCDRSNADSHLRAMLLGHSLTLQISGGEVVLGQWQRILVAELDGPRARTLRVQVMGVA